MGDVWSAGARGAVGTWWWWKRMYVDVRCGRDRRRLSSVRGTQLSHPLWSLERMDPDEYERQSRLRLRAVVCARCTAAPRDLRRLGCSGSGSGPGVVCQDVDGACRIC